MNLDTIPLTVWDKLAAIATDARDGKKNIPVAVGNHFYSNIYETWSMDKVKYAPNAPGNSDGGWSEMVKAWQALQGQNLGSALKDSSKGVAAVQIDKGDADGGTKMARLWEIYNDADIASRFQFVVEAGAGMPLLNRMRRACQLYIKEKLQGNAKDFVIHGWKVFGEAGGVGRSDSCVVYLRKSYTDRSVDEVVQTYVWKEIKDLVDDAFVPLGFFRVGGKPVWALDLPNGATEEKLLGDNSHGSAGGYMSNVFGKAFELASGEKDKAKMIDKAKTEAAGLIKKLFA